MAKLKSGIFCFLEYLVDLMKILLAHKFFYMLGGAEVFFFETARLLKSKGHEIAYFSTADDRNIAVDDPCYFATPPEYKKGSAVAKALQIPRSIFSTDVERLFFEALIKEKPDVVHVFAIHVHLTPSILRACFKYGVPVVMSCNDYKHICPNYKLYHHGRVCFDCKGGKFYSAVLNKCCKDSYAFSAVSALEAYVHRYLKVYDKYVNTYLFASEFMARETERFWGEGKFNWDILRNPFDSTKYGAVNSGGEYVLYFGRLVEEKGVDVLVEAAALAPHVPIKIVGDGEDFPLLRDLAKRLNLGNLEFLGPLWGGELDEVLSHARSVVVPSLWHENFPYVILQAFAAGKPVIGSNMGGIPELVKSGERGLVYDAEDSKALAKAIAILWDDPVSASMMGARAKSYADEEFNDDVQYARLERVYRNSMNGSDVMSRSK